LVDLTIGGVERKTVIVPTKRGEIFVLDRITGEVITEVTERPVPQTDIPGERSSATQPFSTGMPSFAYPKIREQDLFGITPLDQMACRKTFLNLRYEGPMTPPSTQGTLLYPGPAGGMNWGSVAVDEQRQLMVVNNLHLPWVIHLIPRENELTSTEGDFNPGYGIGGPQRGTPFAAKVGLFSSPLNLPCLKPPYGELAVVDLTTQKTVWRRGTGVWNLGLPYAAGTTVTAGGLIFMGGVMDGYFRAIDVKTGELLWKDSLDKASEATPMSYVSPKTGKQYVLVTIPGQRGPNLEESHESDGEVAKPVVVNGGKVIAYALPE
jgi:glucose dehydrogenase